MGGGGEKWNSFVAGEKMNLVQNMHPWYIDLKISRLKYKNNKNETYEMKTLEYQSKTNLP